MTRRKPMTSARRLRILEAHDSRCHICGLPIYPVYQKWEVEHVRALGLMGADDDSNWRPAHAPCHKEKTYQDRKMMARADKAKARHLGAKTPKRPMAGSRASKWKRKVSGEVVER